MTEGEYTTSAAFLRALRAGGVSYLFANLGSDHSGFIEAYARARQDGTAEWFPAPIICPHESVALSAAQGYAQITGQAQAVVVHVECGTQNLGGMLHNAAKGRVPALIFAGASPYTQRGELPGSRNEFIQWIQDVPDQRGIVRGYTKYDNEIRTGRNVDQLVHRALQIAHSEPGGPVYLMGAREVMEEQLDPAVLGTAPVGFTPVASAALAPPVVEMIARALAGAQRPLVITSYLGRRPETVAGLVELCESLAIPVLESVPGYVNFPADHPLHLGYQWNTPRQNPTLAAADVVLVLGSDVPWIPTRNRPADNARVFLIDTDPVKERTPLWHVPAECFARAELGTALGQLTEFVRGHRLAVDTDAIAARLRGVHAEHDELLAAANERERPDGELITPEYLTACVREAIDENTVVLNEGISNYQVINEHLRANRPGSVLTSGGGSLGWYGGAALGVKLARPDQTVVSLVGDGTYLFGVPASAQWVARRYDLPSLTVIYDNQGWKSPKLSTVGVHPHGVAAQHNDFGISFAPEADLPGIARAASGAWARTVSRADELPAAVKEAFAAVRAGQPAVLSAQLPDA
ncbi:MAG TPA: thiamine pyrophosphate-requiring protein [Pseudonocardiaceae bacterium]|nr:thiamine pyrophosphate-requiring protein [Pseudonocardiaceae bacterium]